MRLNQPDFQKQPSKLISSEERHVRAVWIVQLEMMVRKRMCRTTTFLMPLAARGAAVAFTGFVVTGCAAGLSPADGPPTWVGLIFIAPFILMGIIFLLAITTAIGTQMRKVSNSKDSSPPTIETDIDPLRRINPGAYDSHPNGSPTPEQTNSGDDRSHNSGGEAVSPQSSDSWSSGSSSDGGSWSSDSSSSSSSSDSSSSS